MRITAVRIARKLHESNLTFDRYKEELYTLTISRRTALRSLKVYLTRLIHRWHTFLLVCIDFSFIAWRPQTRLKVGDRVHAYP